MTSGKQFTPDPGAYAEMSALMSTAMPFPSLLGTEGKRIVAWLDEQYAASAKDASIPVNATSMIDTLRRLIEEGAHLEPAALTPSPLTDAPDAVREAWLVECIEGETYGKRRKVLDGRQYDPSSDHFWVGDARKRHEVTPLYRLTTPPAKDDAGRLREAGSGDAGDEKPLPKPGLSEADEYLEVQRLAYKTGYNEGYSDASDGLTDRDAAEEGWGQYLEKIEAATEVEHLSPLEAARRAALSPQSDEGEERHG